MNLLRTSTRAAFLEELTNFLIQNFDDNLDKVKVIVSSRYIASCIQKILIQKKRRTLLPDIVPFHNILPESKALFNMNFQELNPSTLIQEQIIIGQIIHSYQSLKYNLPQCLQFAPTLSKLFDGFILNNIGMESIEHLNTSNRAQHWKLIYDFLSNAEVNLKEELKKIGKITAGLHRMKVLNAQINEDSIIVIAGYIGEDNATREYIKRIVNLRGGYLILPPLPEIVDNTPLENLRELDNFFCLRSLLEILNKTFQNFKYIGSLQEPSKLDGIVCSHNNSQKDFDCEINYIEALNVFEEAQVIATLCKNNINKKIAIVICNDSLNECLRLYLKKYNISFQSLIGKPLIKTKIAEFLLSLSDFLCEEFDLKKLFILLKNPLLINENAFKLEKALSGAHRFACSYKEITEVLKIRDESLLNWWQALQINLEGTQLQGKFKDILRNIIITAEKLVNNLWSSQIQGAEDLANMLSELLALEIDLVIKDCKEFCSVLKILLSNHKIFEDINEDVNVLISYPHEAIYLKFDIVILADFNTGSWPPEEAVNPWLNNEMQRELKFYPEQIKSNSYLYNFYLLLHNPKVYITRSLNQGSGELMPSVFLNKLEYACGIINKINVKDVTYKAVGTLSFEENSMRFSKETFPLKLSATDIELIVRSPYSFYIKKILGLKKIDYVEIKPKLSEFGNFIHSVIEQYSKEYRTASSGKVNTSEFSRNYDKETLINQMILIGEKVLTSTYLRAETKKIWSLKLEALAADFIDFDEQRRAQNIKVFSEIRGSFNLKILDKNIEISARADRIEIDQNGSVSILDYKTGTIPSKKDVASGLSPQLIVIAIIILEKGFKEINPVNIKELTYVKIASSKPYVQTFEINLSKEELESHKGALIKLLEYYLTGGEFSKDTDYLKYNDYKHFQRLDPLRINKKIEFAS